MGDDVKRLEQHIADLEKSLEQARKERDAATAALGVAVSAGGVGQQQARELMEACARWEHAATEALKQRDAALADNAAMVRTMEHAAGHLRHTYGHHAQGYRLDPELVSRAIRLLEEVSRHHPGAALLEEMTTMRPAWARLVAIATSQGRSVGGVLDDAEEHHKARRSTENNRSALLEELDTLRQQRAMFDEAATALYGYTEFIGPCAHGRDPWDRCDTCGEGTSVAAAQRVIMKMANEHRKALVSARNEGLEKAAKTVDCACVAPEGFGGEWHHMACTVRKAAEIRAMKEVVPCCERDTDGDGNCDRHLAGAS